MGAALTVTDFVDEGQRYRMGFTVALTGNYTANGVALSLAAEANKSRSIPVGPVHLQSTNGNPAPKFVIGTNQTNGKIKCLTAAGTELAAAAFPAEWTGDTIIGTAYFRKV
jgi:hypothetical protein